MTAVNEAQLVDFACVVAIQLGGASAEARRRELPVIAARLEQAADIIEALVDLLARR
jgi:hypothetical protein